MNQQVPENIRKPSLQQSTEALIFKQKGNTYFKEKNFEQALKMYDQAIQKDPTNSIYYSNKARCLFNLQKYQEALEAAQLTIKRDQKNIKAHYIAAESLVEISEGTKDKNKIEAAIQRLKRCKKIIMQPQLYARAKGRANLRKNLIDKINRAKKKLWILTNEAENQKRKGIRKYLVHLVQTDKNLNDLSKDELNQKILKLVEHGNERDFSKVPSALICPITKKLLKDPVCNEHGHSYSRQEYIKYLQENVGNDPITKKPVKKKGMMYPNINVKKSVQMFLEENPWVYDEVVPV